MLASHFQRLLVLIAAIFVLLFFLFPVSGSAATNNCHPENNKPPGQKLTPEQLKSCESCKNTTNSVALENCVENNTIVLWLQRIVNALSAGVAIIVVAMIMLGGIQYSMAGDNPQAVTAAKQRITNALIALAAFLLISTFLQWLIPGGIFD